MFSVHTIPEDFELKRNNHRTFWIYNVIDLSKASLSKSFPSALKQKASVFKLLRFEERFKKFRFREGYLIGVDGRLNRTKI